MRNVSIWRRFGAILYDSFLVFAILIIMSLPLYNFDLQGSESLKITMQIYYYFITQYFFVWFWVNNQGTLGMKTWEIKIVSDNEEPLTYKKAVVRFNIAILSFLFFGLGFLISIFREDRKCLHDFISRTNLVKP